MPIQWSLQHKKSVTSTNDAAKDLVAAGAPEGTVVTADVQTAGRGSRGRKWISPPGVNLYTSIVLHPNLPPAKTVDLSFVASVSVARTLRDFGLNAMIKWPNDVLVNGRKISGILIETAARTGAAPAAIVGIGINVNWKSLDGEIAKSATSMVLELGKKTAISDLLNALLASFGGIYELYARVGLHAVMEQWRKMQCTVGRDVKVLVEGRTVKGKAAAVDSAGSLIVQTDAGLVTVTAAGTLMPEENEGKLE